MDYVDKESWHIIFLLPKITLSHTCVYICTCVCVHVTVCMYGCDQKTTLDVCLSGLRALVISPLSVSHLSIGAQIHIIGIQLCLASGDLNSKVLVHSWLLVLTSPYSSWDSFLNFYLSKVLYLRYSICGYKLIFIITIVNNIYLISYSHKTSFPTFYFLTSSQHLEAKYMEKFYFYF